MDQFESSDDPRVRADPTRRAAAPDAGESAWITDGSGARRGMDGSGSVLQEIKVRVHRQLLERLNLSNIDALDRAQVVEEIRKVVHDLLAREAVPKQCRAPASTASCGCCGQVPDGKIYQTSILPNQPATTDSKNGRKQGCSTRHSNACCRLWRNWKY